MKHANKDMALKAKTLLEAQVFTPKPDWLKSVEIDNDDHGWFIATKVKNRQSYLQSNVKIPSVINVDGFNVKNCVLILG